MFLKEQEIGDRQQEVLGPDRDQSGEMVGLAGCLTNPSSSSSSLFPTALLFLPLKLEEIFPT